MTNWFITKPTPTVTSPTPSVSVTVATSVSSTTSSATYTTPTVARVPPSAPSITPYTGTNIDSSWVPKTHDDIDYTKICAGCRNPFNNCSEGKWRKICLHRVLDYLENKNFENIVLR